MPEEWQGALEEVGTNFNRPYMDLVTCIVVGFDHIHLYNENGSSKKQYFAKQRERSDL
jgi:hypothetical protein